MMKWIAALGFLLFGSLAANAQGAPCQWNYSFVNGVATAIYCGNVKSSGGLVLTFKVAPIQTSPFSLNSPYTLWPCDASGGSVSGTLPAATGSNETFELKNVGSSGTCTLAAASGDTIDGMTTLPLATKNEALSVIDAAAHIWYVY